MTDSRFGVSILVCCHNSATRLRPTLANLAKLAPASHPWEVIVVDNASTDGTAEVARHAEGQIRTRVRVVSEAQLGHMHARIRGVREAAYDVVSFVDDDNWLEPEWLLHVTSAFSSRPDLGACGALGVAVADIPLPEWFPKFQHAYAVGPQDSPSVSYFLYGAGLSVRKPAITRMLDQGFRPLLTGRQGTALTSGDDGELCLALRLAGWTLQFNSSLRFRHHIPSHRLQWRHLMQLYRRFGEASTFLDAYHQALEEKTRPVVHSLRRSWAYQLGGAVRSLGASASRSFRTEEGTEHVLQREYWVGRVTTLLRAAGSYPSAIPDLARWAAPVKILSSGAE